MNVPDTQPPLKNSLRPLKRVLIANRGEIAVRLINACRDYNVASIAVYAEGDLDALHVQLADEAFALGGERASESYLSIERLLDVARRAGADAIHPGYGFLSERADFARAVQEAGMVWIGPNPETIDVLGDKVKARRLALEVGAPLARGTESPVDSAEEVVAFADEVGLPIAIKAAFGGGGRGLKVAWRMDEVTECYHSAVREAEAAFGRGECFVEQYLDRPRHIEAQIIGDHHGNVVVVGTRDCSLQRRNQKLVEEAPAPFLSDEQRRRIHQAAHDIGTRANYVSAGTVEFLLGSDDTLSFLEVNTRLQVEHPVTEETAGVDLVIEQLRVAEGHPLSFTESPTPRGHSFEFRINAEDPAKGFLPTPGPVETFRAPTGAGVRLDTGVEGGGHVSGHFDSLMAKLIVTGASREQAIARARRALAHFEIEGVASTLPFHRAVMAHPDFTGKQMFNVHTRWIETDFQDNLEWAPRQKPAAEPGMLHAMIDIDGKRHRIGLPAALLAHLAPSAAAPAPEQTPDEGDGSVTSPISGTLLAWQVEDGARVSEGEVIAIMEAMKMETQITAETGGRLVHRAETGATLEAGHVIAEITPE
ncbi:acetyl-CoA/propionyl-CoA carboxylase, biotin carboxylase, biotin carboxyl carrier protein [Kushneria avicenniae]|uniref:Biotin carboxylase n=1 Tax=Kushneria avicenniae TaxID=402385 RepID=A0A1I1JN73_9GAMM|nr:biotin carboxylase N-terminal domain-containing protein [Kushneria avicenniae]SFC47353.1 acetyl-CoA/propionyl-CoA carboxylase, biotin carboxylase, biotin carboxyl carrier protein [Kushneria avicenniae]